MALSASTPVIVARSAALMSKAALALAVGVIDNTS
jgi:hypothetical protein